MNLYEMFEPAPEGLQDAAADNSRPTWGSSRKVKLTLRQINKLRRMQDVRAFEHSEGLKKIRKQYSPPAQEAPPI